VDYALISHAHLPALEAGLADIARRRDAERGACTRVIVDDREDRGIEARQNASPRA
jgi:hypothetical protein